MNYRPQITQDSITQSIKSTVYTTEIEIVRITGKLLLTIIVSLSMIVLLLK